LTGVTVKGTLLRDADITINEAPGDGPFEVFITTALAGSDISRISEALARLISYILQIPSSISPLARLKEVIRQMRNIGGSRSMGFDPNRVVSLPDGFARAMSEYVENKEAPVQSERSFT
jgi:ribonucleoside-diphosphate reductase alpha chain